MATQAERNYLTKQNLIKATQKCILEVGVAGTNATLICQTAGVTRGALNHQYLDGKYGVMADVLDGIFSQIILELNGKHQTCPLLVLEFLLQDLYRDPHSERFLVITDLWLSMRIDERLAEIVGPVFHQANALVWSKLDRHSDDEVDIFIGMVRTFFQGMHLNRFNNELDISILKKQAGLMLKLLQNYKQTLALIA